MVTQDVQLFRATIRENLTFFDASVPDDRLVSVIEELELAEWLNSLPNGLGTVLEAGGGGLSAGQAQLLAFTRVFLRDPGVVVLDEASSRLDPATETLLERAIDHLLEDRTAIVIAHRLSTVQRADDIIILDDGHVVEAGERATLAANPDSHLSRLLETGMEEVLA
jgi:ATP-binding cassette subfamily B protein